MAALNLTIQAGTAPANAALPGNAQALLNFVAAYLLVNGASGFNGINFGASTPAPANQNLPWFKTDPFGNPVGLFSWNGLTWAPIPVVTANGNFSNAPQNPGIGTEYYATDIGCIIIWSSLGWTTASGTVGDVKEVQAATITIALANNPGWIQDTQSIGLAVGGAGAATAITAAHPYGQIVGEENHTMLLSELVAHTHTISANANNASANGNAQSNTGILADHSATATGSTGGGTPFNVLGPRIFYWRLVKQF